MTKKTCETCRWVADPGRYALCMSPRNPGYKTQAHMGLDYQEAPGPIHYVSIHRSGGPINVFMAFITQYICGPQGQWWEPKK